MPCISVASPWSADVIRVPSVRPSICCITQSVGTSEGNNCATYRPDSRSCYHQRLSFLRRVGQLYLSRCASVYTSRWLFRLICPRFLWCDGIQFANCMSLPHFLRAIPGFDLILPFAGGRGMLPFLVSLSWHSIFDPWFLISAKALCRWFFFSCYLFNVNISGCLWYVIISNCGSFSLEDKFFAKRRFIMFCRSSSMKNIYPFRQRWVTW